MLTWARVLDWIFYTQITVLSRAWVLDWIFYTLMKYGNCVMHVCNHVDFFLFPNFKIFYLLNRNSKFSPVFAVGITATRSSKLDLILIYFDNFF